MKKGFTLVELLAIIVILSLLTVVIGTGVVKIVKSSKSKLNSTQEKLILDAAEEYMADHLNSIPEQGCNKIRIKYDLENEGYFNDVSKLNTNTENLSDKCVIVCSDDTSNVVKLNYSIGNC